MGLKQAYKNRKEKGRRIEVRLDDSMLIALSVIRNDSSISISELVREGIRRVIQEAKEKSEIKLI